MKNESWIFLLYFEVNINTSIRAAVVDLAVKRSLVQRILKKQYLYDLSLVKNFHAQTPMSGSPYERCYTFALKRKTTLWQKLFGLTGQNFHIRGFLENVAAISGQLSTCFYMFKTVGIKCNKRNIFFVENVTVNLIVQWQIAFKRIEFFTFIAVTREYSQVKIINLRNVCYGKIR